MPRGLASGVPALEIPAAAYATYQSGGPRALAALAAVAPFQSPRALGAITHTAGRLYGSLGLPALGQPLNSAPFAMSQTNKLQGLTAQ